MLLQEGHLLDHVLAVGGQVLQLLFQDQLSLAFQRPAKVLLHGFDARGQLVVLGLVFLLPLGDVVYA